MNAVRRAVDSLGGIAPAADASGVSRSALGRACVTGEIPKLGAAMRLADAAGYRGADLLAFLTDVRPDHGVNDETENDRVAGAG